MEQSSTPVCVGMDIGGSHVTAGLHEAATGELIAGSMAHLSVNSGGPAEKILETWAATLRQSFSVVGNRSLLGIGIAMPGPFDYEQGISQIRGLAKYESLYGMNVRDALKSRLDLNIPIIFRNDAACFTLGEAWNGAAKGCTRVIGITLGTGFGSAFVASGELVDSGPDVPVDGMFFDKPFRGKTAEDWFSGRGLLAIAAEATGRPFATVRDYADAVRAATAPADGFTRYGSLMGEFLAPWVARFKPECLVVGGNIARSLDLFAEPMKKAIGAPIDIRQSLHFEQAALSGAASLPLHYREPESQQG